MNAIELIGAERERQIAEEGWTPEHDVQHNEGELAWAAMYYAMPCTIRHKCVCGRSSFRTPDSFWAETGWRPELAKRDGKDRLRQLVVAGALIAAEIDRLLPEAPEVKDVP